MSGIAKQCGFYPRFAKPFYYRRAAHGMAFILLFNKTFTLDDQIRFSLFKFTVPKYPHPAWDFQYVINKIEKDKEYGFEGRLVWKRFINAQDCLREYEKWRSEMTVPENLESQTDAVKQ
jgi:hypothetical protein